MRNACRTRSAPIAGLHRLLLHRLAFCRQRRREFAALLRRLGNLNVVLASPAGMWCRCFELARTH